MFKTESDLARTVISWLEDYQWEVYQEVQFHEKIADIVAIQNNIVWVVETKLSSTLKVIEQAEFWKPYGHYVSVAVPIKRGQRMFDRILNMLGIGKLSCSFEVREIVAPRINRKTLSKRMLNVLTPDHKTFAIAGNSEGSRLTPFKKTCMKITREVEKSPGITIKELLEKIKTHYSTPVTARTCIAKWIGTKHINVRFEKEGKRLKLYPKEKTTC